MGANTLRAGARLLLFAVLTAGLAIPVLAGSLTTFEQYAAMTPEQQSAVRANAASVVFENALTRHDDTQADCLRRTYSTQYGPKLEVQLAHARLRGWLEAGIENHNDESRVEYAVAFHMEEECPPTNPSAAH